MLPLPAAPPPHSREDAFLEELLFSYWFVGGLTQLFTLAEQVGKEALEEGESVSIVVAWFCGCSRYSIRILGG